MSTIFWIKSTMKTAVAVTALAFVMTGVVLPLSVAAAIPPAAGNCDTPGQNGCDYIPLTTIPGAFNGCNPTITKDSSGKVTAISTANCAPADPVKVIKNIYSVSIGIAAILAVAVITWAGIEYATTEAITGKSDAKERWTGAIWGLVLLLSAYIILKTINVDLVNINLDLGTPVNGGAVSGDPLANVINAANKSAADLQTAEQKAADAQKSLDSLKTSRAALAAQIQQHATDAAYLNSADGRAAKAQLDQLDSTISQQETAAKNAQINVAQSKIQQLSNQNDLLLQKHLISGDIEMAKTVQNTTESALRTKIADLKSSGASPEQVNVAEGEAAAINFLDGQAVDGLSKIQSVQNELHSGFTDVSTIANDSLLVLNNYQSTIADNAQKLKDYGVAPATIADYQSRSNAQLELLKQKLPVTQRCSNYTKNIQGDIITITCTP